MTIAVVFPGQGSQSVGMMAELAEAFEQVPSTFEEAADFLGRDLWKLAKAGPVEVINDTRNTQPLMFTAAVATWRCLRARGLAMPGAMAGHSLGEFAAMVAAGALSFTDGLALVQRRSTLMAAAVPEGEGGMAALIGMDDDAVVELCASISGERISEAVNFNAPGQVAISGHLDALDKTLLAAKDKGCRKAIMLPVSVPNHSSLMTTAGQGLAATIDTVDFVAPAMPLLQNATARAPADLAELLTHLKAHVYSPVYWTQTVQNLRDEHGVELIIEAGPGRVLTGLSKRIDRSLRTLPVDSPDTLAAAIEAAAALSEAKSV